MHGLAACDFRRRVFTVFTSFYFRLNRMRRTDAAYCRTFRGLCVCLCVGHAGEACRRHRTHVTHIAVCYGSVRPSLCPSHAHAGIPLQTAIIKLGQLM